MAYEKVVDLGTDNVTALGGTDNKTGKPNPSKMEGYYLGSREVATSTGQSRIHVFQTPKGNQGLWGTKKLNDNLTPKVVGHMVLVEYKGKVKINGGKTQHTYNIFHDRDNKIEVVGSESAGNYIDSAEETDDTQISGDFQEEDTNQEAALVAAEQQAKVQAMLKKARLDRTKN